MAMNSLQELYLEQLEDLHSAETQITKALPKMAQAAKHPELRAAFEKHLRETEEQLRRLEHVGQSLGASLGGHECKGMKGLIAEGEEMMKERADSDVLDAALIAAAQRVEHYEIAGYGCCRTYANLLGREADAQILQSTLDEEGRTDKLLTELAERIINVDAARHDREVARGAAREGTSERAAQPSGARRETRDEAR